jgi:ribosome maturation factor RimP
MFCFRNDLGMAKSVESRINELVAGDIAASGYELVRVLIKGNGKYATLQIMAERKDSVGMTVEDCVLISKSVSAMLEADKELADRFDLEVSSPGIDRPLMKLQDYTRFQGHIAKIELGTPVGGQKKFQGKIARVSDDAIEFGTEKGAVNVPFEAIAKAQLVLTDELLKAAASGKISH